MKLGFVFTVLLVSTTGAFGQIEGNPENWCRGGFFSREYSDFKIGTAIGTKAARTHFFNDDPENCPAGTGCRSKSYIVGGDRVLVSKTFNGYVCSWYVAANGRETVGWLPSKSLTLSDTDKQPALAKWYGTWKYADSAITFTDNKLAGFLNVTGDAFWKGLGDNIHVGEIDGRFAPEGNLLEYSEGDNEFDCKATMRLIGEYLVVADNLKCGGLNVTFSGVYRKTGKARPGK